MQKRRISSADLHRINKLELQDFQYDEGHYLVKSASYERSGSRVGAKALLIGHEKQKRKMKFVYVDYKKRKNENKFSSLNLDYPIGYLDI